MKSDVHGRELGSKDFSPGETYSAIRGVEELLYLHTYTHKQTKYPSALPSHTTSFLFSLLQHAALPVGSKPNELWRHVPSRASFNNNSASHPQLGARHPQNILEHSPNISEHSRTFSNISNLLLKTFSFFHPNTLLDLINQILSFFSLEDLLPVALPSL
jgi:hypothetical protein